MKHAHSAFSLPASLDSEVRDVMTPGVVSIPADTTLRQAHEALEAHGVHALLVTDEHTGSSLGWITVRGLLGWATSRSTSHTAKQAISEPVVRVAPSARVEEAVTRMLDGDVSRLVVARNDNVLPEGVICDSDVVRLGGRA